MGNEVIANAIRIKFDQATNCIILMTSHLVSLDCSYVIKID